MHSDLLLEIRSVLNKYSCENESNTPDLILAEYLVGCLEIFNSAVKKRNQFFVTDKEPGQVTAYPFARDNQ